MAKTIVPEEILLADITGKSVAHVLAHPEIINSLTKAQAKKLQNMQKQLSLGMPLAYVLGYKYFFEHKLSVNKDTLIPRPETETLVEATEAWAKQNKPTLVCDIGTGTGAIAIALASRFPKTKVIASDISKKALLMAKKNAKQNKIKNISFVQGNLSLPLQKAFAKNKYRNILICSNPPYLTKKQLSEKTIQHEPKLALYGGENSFAKIEQLLKQLAKLPLQNSALFLEMNYNHGKQLQDKAKKYLPNASVEIFKDLSGFARFGLISFTGAS